DPYGDPPNGRRSRQLSPGPTERVAPAFERREGLRVEREKLGGVERLVSHRRAARVVCPKPRLLSLLAPDHEEMLAGSEPSAVDGVAGGARPILRRVDPARRIDEAQPARADDEKRRVRRGPEDPMRPRRRGQPSEAPSDMSQQDAAVRA